MLNLKSYGENVAAITARLYEDKAIFEEIYSKISDEIGGFVGIWNICAEAAEVFSEEENPYNDGEDFYWLEAIESYADSIIGYLKNGTLPTIYKMHLLAAGAIEKNFIHR